MRFYMGGYEVMKLCVLVFVGEFFGAFIRRSCVRALCILYDIWVCLHFGFFALAIPKDKR